MIQMGKKRVDQTAKIPDFTNPQWVSLDKMTGRKLNEYMVGAGHNRAKDVIAELVAIALSHNAAEAIDGFMRKKAFDETRVGILNSFYGWLKEEQERAERAMKELGWQRLEDGTLNRIGVGNGNGP